MNGRFATFCRIAAVLVFATTILTLTYLTNHALRPLLKDHADSEIATGWIIAAAGSLVMAMRIWHDFNARLVIASLAAAICGVALCYNAARNEITGTAMYNYGRQGRSSVAELVTREGAPREFRASTNSLWNLGLSSFSISAIIFALYRYLDD